MINISPLEQYFPTTNKPLRAGKYTFTIALQEGETTFLINLKIKQRSIPGEHLIKFRVGIGQDKPQEDASHETEKPHFEIETYKKDDDIITTTVYFTFQDETDEQLARYAKGTVMMIEKILQRFFTKNKLERQLLETIVHTKAVSRELEGYDDTLINGLAESFRTGNLILRDGRTVIRTTHNLKKCLSAPELEPLLLPLIEKVRRPHNNP